jgi:hypothetical protein
VNLPVQAQWPVYYQCDGNADNTFDAIPAELAGARWIATRRQSLAATGLSFQVKDRGPLDVYVLFTRQSAVPAWIPAAGFSATGVSGTWRDHAMYPDFVVLMKPAGATGLRQTPGAAPARHLVFLSTGRRIRVPAIPGGPAREVSMYDLSGKCLARAVLGREASVFDAGEAAAGGLHLIRVRGL